MAGKFTRLQKTYLVEGADAVEMYRGVTYGASEGSCRKPAADNAVPLGVVDNDAREAGQAGKQVAVKLEGIAAIQLTGTVAYGQRVILAANGFARALPTAAGQYNVLGFAENAGVNGDVIPVRMAFHAFTV